MIDGVLITLVYLVFSGIFLSSLAGSDISYSNDANGNLISTGGPGAGFFVSLLVGLLLVFLITLAYEVVMIALRGATVGKQLLGVKVVRESDGQVPGWGRRCCAGSCRWRRPSSRSSVCSGRWWSTCPRCSTAPGATRAGTTRWRRRWSSRRGDGGPLPDRRGGTMTG